MDLKLLISQMVVKDLIDILMVAFFFYIVFTLIKGTRAVQILQGVGVLLLIMLITYLLKLETIYWLLRYSLISIAVAIPIVFQPELRRALGLLGRGGVFHSVMTPLDKEAVTKIADEITWTASILSQAKIGAIMVLEKETGLTEFIETGVKVNGEISSKLLLSIFMPKSPLHDGAVIIRGDKVVAASCYLPLSENVGMGKASIGTRHRASLGISEQTDCLVVVVSEETGNISTAKNGKLTVIKEEELLKKIITSIYNTENFHKNKSAENGGKDVFRNVKKESRS